MSRSRSGGGIFISYRREETAAYAGRLYDRLSDRFGEDRVFMDVDSIAIGVDFVTAIQKAVSGCAILLVIIGRDWSAITDNKGRRRIENPDDFVRLEIEAALQRNIRVVPVLVDGAALPQGADLPLSLRSLIRRQTLVLSHTNFRSEISRLVSAIDEVVEVAPGPPSMTAPEIPAERSSGEWHAQISVIRVSSAVHETRVVIELTHENHNLVARYSAAWRDHLQLDGTTIASSLNNIDGNHDFSVSDGPRKLAARVEIEQFPPTKVIKYYKVRRLVIDKREVPLIEHPM